MEFRAWQHAHPMKHEFVLWPGVTNNEATARAIQDRFMPSLFDFAESPIAKECNFVGFGRVLNYPGYPSSPYSLPNIDNSLGDVDLRPEFVEDLTMTFKVLFGEYPDHLGRRPLTLRRAANSGLPLFTRDPVKKVEGLNRIFKNLGSFSKMIISDDWDGLKREFGVVPVVTLGSRTQTDSIKVTRNGSSYDAEPKEREAITAWDAATNKQVRVKIDKGLGRFGMNVKLYSMRHRTIYAIPMFLNAPLMPVGNAFFDAAVHQFPLTFEAADVFEFVKKEPVRSLLKSRVILSFDFKEFDHSVPTVALWLFCQLMRTVGVADWVSKLAFDVTHLPCIMNGRTLDGSDPCPTILGDLRQWYRPAQQIHFGLPSGWAFTSLFPKWFVTTLIYHVLWRVCKVIPRSEASYRAFLSWDPRCPVHDMCGGDDNALTLEPKVLQRVRDTFCAGVTDTVPTMRVEWDDTPQFLSHLFGRDASGYVTAMPDVVRGFTNSFCPAESAFPMIFRESKPSYNPDSLSRFYGITGTADPSMLKNGSKVPAFGWFEKDKLYTARNPAWAPLRELMFDFLLRLNPNLKIALRQIADVESTMLARLKVDALNVADLNVINNPDKIFYRYSEDQISDGVYKLAFISYGEEFLDTIREYYLQ